ncbi:MAG: RNA polymerase sigma factor [Isosphaeraceae bacterium]
MMRSSPNVLGSIRTLFGVGTLGGLTDGELLERFVASRWELARADAELAFVALMERHGPMVWRVCRSLVSDEHDAEDAFQATFLVLVRKAGSLKVQTSLGPWLYSVAYRVGLNTRSITARQTAIRRSEATRLGGPSRGEARASDLDPESLALPIHQEIMRLPEVFRTALLLCDIDGLSYQKAADTLKIPLGTLQSRLARARRRLRDRLQRKGIALDSSVGQLPAPRLPNAALLPPLQLPGGLVDRSRQGIVEYALGGAHLDSFGSELLPQLVKTGIRTGLPYRPIALVMIITGLTALCGAMAVQDHAPANPRANAFGSSGPSLEVGASAQSPRRSRTVGLLSFPPPYDLKVAAGRGKALVYELDQNGNRISAPPALEPRGPQSRRRRRRREIDPKGDRIGARPDPLDSLPAKEVARDIHWAVVTGIVDHRAIRASFSTIQLAFSPEAGKKKSDPATPRPPEEIYRRVDVERQVLEASGAWSDWQPVDFEPNLRVLDNVPEVEGEQTQPQFRCTPLVDPLPFLKEGKWSGVDVERFILAGPPEKEHRVPLSDRELASDEKTESPELMLRSLDFTVLPGRIYRYRVRLIFRMPRVPEIPGPWSQPTEPVMIP